MPTPPYGPLFADLTSSYVLPTGFSVTYSMADIAYAALNESWAPKLDPFFTGTVNVSGGQNITGNLSVSGTIGVVGNVSASGATQAAHLVTMAQATSLPGTSSTHFLVNSTGSAISGAIGVIGAGGSTAYFYSDQTDWGLYSAAAGGYLISCTQTGGTVQVGNGNPITIASGISNNHAVNLGQISQNTLIGEVKDWPSNVLPAKYVWANGQALSRATYAALFLAYGTQFGAGDGATTFNVPDRRGLVAAGSDSMGGATAAGRLTSGAIGVAATLGVITGSQYTQAHAHGIYDPGHVHGVSDPGHAHVVNDPGHNHYVNDPGHNHYVNDPGHLHGIPATNDEGVPGSDLVLGGTTGGNLNSDSARTGIYLSASGTGVYNSAADTGVGVESHTTGVGVASNTTAITVNPAGTGTTQNIQPTFVTNYIIYAGV